jgi:ABC-type branched-subunit amino acid transport system substrate-binding protein
MRDRGSNPAGVRTTAMLAVFALLLSACGSTAYRDRIAIQELAVDQDSGELPGLPGAEDAEAAAGTADGEVSFDEDDGEPSELAAPGEQGGPTDADGSATEGSAAEGGASGGAGTSASEGSGGGSGNGAAPRGSSPRGGGSGAGSGLPQTTENGRGVTDDTIRLGFITLTSFQNLGSNLGFTVADKGDVAQQIRDLSSWINDNGGIAGRRIEPSIRVYKQEEASPGAEAQLCNAFADDDKVFGVMLYGQIHESTRYCYAGKGVLMIDPTPFTYDSVLYQEVAPFLWNPEFPNYSKVMRTLPGALHRADYFKPMSSRNETDVKLGVVHWDSPFANRVLQRDLVPALEAVGQKVTSAYGVDGSSVATIQNGLSNAITRFRQAGVNRVVFIGGSPLAPFFFQTAESNNFRPRYGMTSLENPRHSSSDRGTPAQMADAVGIGFNIDTDVRDQDVAMPATSTERTCLEVLRKKGHTFEKRENANYALAVCSSLLLLQQGGKTITDGITAPLWAAHAERLGSSFKPAMWYSATFGPGRHDGNNQYRPLRFDRSCQCFRYTGDLANFR